MPVDNKDIKETEDSQECLFDVLKASSICFAAKQPTMHFKTIATSIYQQTI
jgi:hypothetical protein